METGVKQRLDGLEQRIQRLEQGASRRSPAWGRVDGVPTPPRTNGELFPAVKDLMSKAKEADSPGLMSFAGFHRMSGDDTSRFYQWQLADIATELVLAMDDARNVRVLSALAHPVRLRMMKSILQQPGTAAELRERLNLTSTGQTYHALKALENGGMIQQEPDGTYVAIGDKACGFLILLGGLFNLTESKYDPAFVHIPTEDEPES